MKPLNQISGEIMGAWQTGPLPRYKWRAGDALVWPIQATPIQAAMDAAVGDPLAINPWLATVVRIVSFSILVFMAFVASAP